MRNVQTLCKSFIAVYDNLREFFSRIFELFFTHVFLSVSILLNCVHCYGFTRTKNACNASLCVTRTVRWPENTGDTHKSVSKCSGNIVWAEGQSLTHTGILHCPLATFTEAVHHMQSY